MKQLQAVRNAADPEQLEKAGKKQDNREKRDEADLKWILSTPQGRRCLYRLILQSGYNVRFEADDMQYIQFAHGRRDVGLKIVEYICNVQPEAWILMQKEALQQEEVN